MYRVERNLYDSYFTITKEEYDNINRSNIEDYVSYSDILDFCMDKGIYESYSDNDRLNTDEVLNDYYEDILYSFKDRILDDIEYRNRIKDSYRQ